MAEKTGKVVDVEQAVANATGYGDQRRRELGMRLREKQAQAQIAMDAQTRWLASCKDAAAGSSRRVVVFPIGDSLLEPFWPQGLGSNRGFHSALDACYAVSVLRREGLDAALLDRQFSYDVMINQPFHAGTNEAGAHWRADYLTRYAGPALSSMVLMYANPSAKRLFKGKGAVPKRVAAMREAGTLGKKR